MLANKRTTVVVALIAGCLLALSAYLVVTKVILHARIALAEEQIDIFYAMRDKAAVSSPDEAAACLEYLVGYYPSGTKQVTGSRLDLIVERVRRNVAEEIISDVRVRAGSEQAALLRKLTATLAPIENHNPRMQTDAAVKGDGGDEGE